MAGVPWYRSAVDDGHGGRGPVHGGGQEEGMDGGFPWSSHEGPTHRRHLRTQESVCTGLPTYRQLAGSLPGD